VRGISVTRIVAESLRQRSGTRGTTVRVLLEFLKFSLASSDAVGAVTPWRDSLFETERFLTASGDCVIFGTLGISLAVLDSFFHRSVGLIGPAAEPAAGFCDCSAAEEAGTSSSLGGAGRWRKPLSVSNCVWRAKSTSFSAFRRAASFAIFFESSASARAA